MREPYITENLSDKKAGIMMAKKKRGVFITFEGIEGCGKTTQSKKLYDFLKKNNLSVYLTKEPGGTKFGERLRDIFLSKEIGINNPIVELFLILTDRSEHINELILPAIEGGAIVISDRYYDSTTAYQGYGRGLSISEIYRIHRDLINAPTPDITFFLDIPVLDGLKRVDKRGTGKNRLDDEELSFHERVRKGYMEIAKAEKERFIVIDGSKDIKTVHDYIVMTLRNKGLMNAD